MTTYTLENISSIERVFNEKRKLSTSFVRRRIEILHLISLQTSLVYLGPCTFSVVEVKGRETVNVRYLLHDTDIGPYVPTFCVRNGRSSSVRSIFCCVYIH